MNDEPYIKLRDMKRSDWVVWHWINVQTNGDVEPVFLRGRMRTIDEAYQAGIEYDAVWPSYSKVLNDEPLTGDGNTAVTTLHEVGLAIANWLDELGIKKSWPATLHPADILNKYIFPELAERFNDEQSTGE